MKLPSLLAVVLSVILIGHHANGQEDTTKTTVPGLEQTNDVDVSPTDVGILEPENSTTSTEDGPSKNDVLDTAAWIGGWILAVGSYAGRQNRRPSYNGYIGYAEDLPKIYIPNQLTAGELNRALRLTTEKQAVTEVNEMSSFIDFFVSKRSREDLARTPFLTLYVDDKDNSFVVSEEALNDTRVSLTAEGIEEELAEMVVDLLKVLRWPVGGLNTFEELFSEANRQYMEVMSFMENMGLAKLDKGDLQTSYTLTKNASRLVHSALNVTVWHPCSTTSYCNLEDYWVFREYKRFQEQNQDMVDTSASIVRLPTDLSWNSVKATLQTIYKEGVQNVHLFQFLTKTLDYLNIDTGVKGMSQLSPSMTQALTDSMWHLFGRIHPISN